LLTPTPPRRVPMLKKFVSIASVLALSVAFVGCEAATEKAKVDAAATPAATAPAAEHAEHAEAAVTPAAETTPEAAPEAAK
jgi:hypothetical protein